MHIILLKKESASSKLKGQENLFLKGRHRKKWEQTMAMM